MTMTMTIIMMTMTNDNYKSNFFESWFPKGLHSVCVYQQSVEFVQWLDAICPTSRILLGEEPVNSLHSLIGRY